MKLTYNRYHNLMRLGTELLRLPFLQPITRPDGALEAVFILCGDNQTVYLDVPDDLTSEQIAEIERVINSHYPDLVVIVSANPVAVNETVIVTATLPAGAPDTEVTFQVEDGTAYIEPVVNGEASHAYAFILSGTYRINVSSAKCGSVLVEMVVQ